MKAIFIAYDQAHHDKIIDVLTRANCRPGTVSGRRSVKGAPHSGTHAWPSLAGAILPLVEDRAVDGVLKQLRAIDEEKPLLGLRAFTWNIEQTI